MERTSTVKWHLLLLGTLFSAQVSLAVGNPLLLVGTSTSQFSLYIAELLRAEGLNGFDAADISAVTAGTLSAYDVVILGQVTLTPAQVTTFTNWVNAGGSLIAMRPDKQLSSLFGITDTGTTLSNGYLLVNSASPPGTGIVGQTIQFHGTADQYLPNGALPIATLYSSSTVATPHPAVTLRTGIGAGGRAVAFTYDLARSVVYTRQGNPAWTGQARVGQGGPIRAVDMFYGNASFDPQPDWADPNKIAIPQADEQQRLLANIILYLNQTKKPIPRFWYLPFGKKAAVIMTGDDHAGGATAGRFDDFIASSPAGCSLANWECIRATSYLYPYSPLTNSQAANYVAQGFEVALHVSTNCADYTSSSLESFVVSQLTSFRTNYSSVPAPVTNRTHCIAWSEWDTHAQVELNHGIRLDTNYYYWPPSWVVATPGFFTGSGMPMRFAQLDGTLIDVYQAATQMTDESGQVYPDTINGLLDNAVGPAGFYGVFTANMHNDANGGDTQLWADQIVSAAKSRGVPVVSAKQMLQWLDGRSASSFGSIVWSGNTLTFTITVGAGANGLQAMLPYASSAGGLSGITQNGTPVSYSLQTIKGVQYAFFSAVTGAYQATYSTALPPVISAVTATPGTTTATITWTTDKNSNSRVDYGTTPSLGTSASDSGFVTAHSITLTGLTVGTTYYYRVTSTDAGGNSASSPASPASFTTLDPAPPVITAVTAIPGAGGTASIAWTTSKASNSRVDYGTTTALGAAVSDAGMVTAHSITLTGLIAGTTYYYRVTSSDALNNSTSWPSVSGTSSFVQNAPATVWASSATPASIDSGDRGALELGMKFRSDVGGTVTAIRFYKAAANTGTHTGHLWTSTGTLLGTVTFTNETTSGWQQANFAAPVAIAANTTYIVSYFAPNGHYSDSLGFFTSAGVDTPPLHALRSGVDGLNGVYAYGSSSAFPNSSWNGSNYWVDLVFFDNVPPSISAVTAAPTPTTAIITWTTDEASNSRVDYGTTTALGSTVSNAGMVTAHTVTLTGLTTGTTCYYRVTSMDGFGNSTTSPASPNAPLAFVPADTTPPVISAVVASQGSTGATITWTTDENSTSRVEYGTTTSLATVASDPALVTAHSITLSTLAPGTTYYFRVTSADAYNNSASSPSAPNTSSFTTIDNSPPVISSVAATPLAGNTAAITWITNKLSNSRVDYGATSALGSTVSDAGMVTAHSLTLSELTAGRTYFYRVTSVDALNNSTSWPSTSGSATFVENSLVSVWTSSATPSMIDSADGNAVEIGMKFRSDVAGTVTGVRFYKAAANTGAHTGHLWSSTGTLLGTATFTNETTSGWQQANLATPVSIAANTTYIVSYFAPNGHYSANNNFFTSAGVDTPPLHALRSGVDGLNGIYRYGSASAFPNSSWANSNYWVDVVFSGGDTTPPTVTAFTIPGNSASLTVAITTFTATDNVGVAGYLLTESAAAPSAVSAGWTAAAPASYTFTSTGTKTLYAWAKDAAGNVSTARSATVVITLSDQVPPTVTAFIIPSTAGSLVVPITTFTANDNVGVTGYLLTESATAPSPAAVGWAASASASYTFTSAGAKTLYAWAKDAAGNVSASRSASVVITLQTTGPEPAGWYAGDMHVHRSCGGSPESLSSLYDKMTPQNLAAISLLADMGNGEVQNPATDLPLVNGQDSSVSTTGRIVHWDAEWHWDATYAQYPHQALGGHLVALGLTGAQQIWQEYTYPVLNWARQQGGIAGFAHMQYLDGEIPQSLTCCTPIEYPVEVALGAADFISEDVADSGSGLGMYPDNFIQAYYKLLNTGFRPGFAAGTDYPCNTSRPLGFLLTYAQPAGGQMTYGRWIRAIANGRTVVSRNGHNEFLALTVNGTATPGDQVSLAAAGSVSVTVQWSAAQNLSGTIELVSNSAVVASNSGSAAPGAPMIWNTTVNFPKSGWLVARRMGSDGHMVHTAAVFVIVNSTPIRASASDAQFFVSWMDNLLTKTSAGGAWNSYFPASLAQAQARYQAAKTLFQQRAAESGSASGPGIFTTQVPAVYDNDSAYELGTRFWADVNGDITQVGLYTNALEGGSHTVRIWRVGDSTLLAGPYTWNITSGMEGWKTFSLPAALSIVANTDYIVSISNSSDHYYAATVHGFDSPIVNAHLHTYTGSGVYTTTLGAMPTSNWQNSNYFRDIGFVPK